jgi:hypothetical protein
MLAVVEVAYLPALIIHLLVVVVKVVVVMALKNIAIPALMLQTV